MSERPEFKRPRSRIISDDARIRAVIGEKLRANFSFADHARPKYMSDLLERLEARERSHGRRDVPGASTER
jgi:hypothetical protein